MELLASSKRKLLRDRERNLCKKADELSILCGTDVCMIIFKPHMTKPEIWPQDFTKVQRIIKKYKEKVAMRNNDDKGLRSPSSQAIRNATDATTSHSASDREQNKKRMDLSLSNSYDSDSTGKKSHADYNSLNAGSAKRSNNVSTGDDKVKLASLEAKLQAITKIIALREATCDKILADCL